MDKKNNEVSRFLDFVANILQRPAMFQVNNVEDVYLILFGYGVGNIGNDVDNLMHDFRVFINEDFNSTDNYDWVRLIRFHSGSNIGSLELLKIKFDAFLDLRG